jgi:hypothetical protein
VTASTYRLTLAGTAGDLGITRDLTIKGAGPAATVVNAAGVGRDFHILPGGVATLSGLTNEGGLTRMVHRTIHAIILHQPLDHARADW